MSKLPSLSCYVCLASVLIHIFLTSNFYGGGRNQLNWTKSAAEEAEFVASIDCSGHGRAFIDGLVVDGKPVCECYSCFYGPKCSEFSPDCVADANKGDPLFLEPFWMQNPGSSAMVVSGWHRMSYSFADDDSMISQELHKQIRQVHAITKNAITDGKYIVIGAGSTQVTLAAIYALSLRNSPFPTQIVAPAPHYQIYKLQIDYFKTPYFEFAGCTSLIKNASGAQNVIEFVTSPNNPDGQLRKAVLKGSSVATIHDFAYYWPHYTAITAPADEDLMMFSISKLTGHAGTRFGWAIVKDKSIYEKMKTYITLSELDVSKDTQLRALKLLKVITKDNGKEIFDFGYKTMRSRWERLSEVISVSNRFSLQPNSPQYCQFFNNVRQLSPAYGWLKCEREEDKDCAAILRAANISGSNGKKFNAESRYARLSLLQSPDDFGWLIHRLNDLVTRQEEGSAEAI